MMNTGTEKDSSGKEARQNDQIWQDFYEALQEQGSGVRIEFQPSFNSFAICSSYFIKEVITGKGQTEVYIHDFGVKQLIAIIYLDKALTRRNAATHLDLCNENFRIHFASDTTPPECVIRGKLESYVIQIGGTELKFLKARAH